MKDIPKLYLAQVGRNYHRLSAEVQAGLSTKQVWVLVAGDSDE